MQTRRTFIRTAAATAVALPTRRVLGANDRLRLGIIGSGNRATGVMQQFLKAGSVEVVAVNDIWDEAIARCREKIREKIPAPVAGEFKEYRDYRALLDRKDVDAVLIGTPDHWHLQPFLDACQSGKDIYIEKPLTFSLDEGRKMVEAARQHRRIVQVGMQQRSGEHYREAKELYIDSGKIGKVTLARTWWHGNQFHLRRAPFTAKPAGLDWKAFLGRRPWREWDAQQYWNWRAYLDFGGGQITDLFTHWIDVVQWFMKEEMPVSAVSAGGVYHYKDGRTAPDTINVLLEYPSAWTATFEATLAPGTRGAAIEFVGTEGSLTISRSAYTWAPRQGEKVERKAGPEDMTAAHVRDFLEAVRNRRNGSADTATGNRAAISSHLGNIAYVEKRRIVYDAAREEARKA